MCNISDEKARLSVHKHEVKEKQQKHKEREGEEEFEELSATSIRKSRSNASIADCMPVHFCNVPNPLLHRAVSVSKR